MAENDQSLNENEIDPQHENLQPEAELKGEQLEELQAEQLAELQSDLQSEPQEEQQSKHEDDSVAVGGERWPGWPGESVFRILVPSQKVGSIIGRKGEYIKKMCEETKARIKILDGSPGTTERAVMVSAKEDPELSLPPAIDGLLKVHKRVVDGLNSELAPAVGGKVSTRLLVPAAQAGNLIGKQGTTVKSIQEVSNCIVRVLGTEDLPIFAFPDDRIVEVSGDPAATHKGIELIASHLRKFLVDRSIISVFESQMQKSAPHMEYVPPNQSWGPPPPQPFPPSVAGPPGYRATNPFFPPPPRQHESYYSSVEMPPHLEKQPYLGMSAYNREAPLAVQSSSSNNQAVQSLITQVTQQMVIPLSYADAVIGTDGASISYIRRVSGATVTIQENRDVPGEMTAEISGSAPQVQTAQQLIQNCIAEAAAAQTQAATTTDQGYNVYASQSSLYAPAPSNPGVGGQSGGYGSVYGGNYGY